MWRVVYQSKDKHVVKNDKTGKVRQVYYDQKYREAAQRGDFTQPIGKDKERWFRNHPRFKENIKGEIVDKELEKEKEQWKDEQMVSKEKEDFEKRRKETRVFMP